MKVLFGYRYGILGGVATQLVNRLRWLRTVPGFEATVVFMEDHGVGPTLAPYARVVFERDPTTFGTLAAEHDVTAVIDTKELLEHARGPLVCEVHTTVEFGLAYLCERSWRANTFIVPSKYSRDLIRDRFAVPDAEIEIVPNIVDSTLFHPHATREQPERPILLWVGKLDDHKNWETFLEIGALVGKDVELWIAGGETAPQATAERMLETAEGLEIIDRLRWFPHVEYEAMSALLSHVAASGGCAVVTSKDESFGMSVAEALLSGCPVVASRVGAIPELAPDRAYLRLYTLGDVDAAVVEIKRTLRDSPRPEHEELAKKLSPETIGPRYLEVLESARRRRGSR